MSRGKHRARHIGRGTTILLMVLAVLLVATAGTAFAAYRYDKSHAGTFLPGITVSGVALDDMTRDQAIAAVSRAIDPDLTQHLTITAAKKKWTMTMAELGLHADVTTAVDQAMAYSDSFGFFSRVYHRVANKPVTRSFTVAYDLDTSPISTFVAGVAKRVRLDPVDASFALVDGKVDTTHARDGRALKEAVSAAALTKAVNERRTAVRLPVFAKPPDVADDQIGKHIIVNRSLNRLYLYDGFKVERSYPVATAKLGFQTPPGAWTIINKVENPTWHNPAPNGWGAGEPLVIPPGPGNPLGTRALYLNAPGIRIHGTPSDSSIGTYASHGCIRMHISDSEALYPLVPVGTPVYIIGAPPWGDSVPSGPAG